jgi:hypothetical protein
MPIYNRSWCKPLIISNVVKLDYPLEKLELIIDDDSDVNPLFKNIKEEAEFRIMIEPVKLFYLKNKQKRTIGQKRNNLVKKANNKIIAMMDQMIYIYLII